MGLRSSRFSISSVVNGSLTGTISSPRSCQLRRTALGTSPGLTSTQFSTPHSSAEPSHSCPPFTPRLRGNGLCLYFFWRFLWAVKEPGSLSPGPIFSPPRRNAGYVNGCQRPPKHLPFPPLRGLPLPRPGHGPPPCAPPLPLSAPGPFPRFLRTVPGEKARTIQCSTPNPSPFPRRKISSPC